MPLYICRWQDGSFSAVSAHSREYAILLLAEIGNAEARELFCLRDFMVHFRLKDRICDIERATPLELQGFGLGTLDMLYNRVYPVYGHAIVGAVEPWPEEEPEQLLINLNDALSTEHTRQWNAQKPDVSGTSETAELERVEQKTAPDIRRRQFP